MYFPPFGGQAAVASHFTSLEGISLWAGTLAHMSGVVA
jgi:hypothetical protein